MDLEGCGPYLGLEVEHIKLGFSTLICASLESKLGLALPLGISYGVTCLGGKSVLLHVSFLLPNSISRLNLSLFFLETSSPLLLYIEESAPYKNIHEYSIETLLRLQTPLFL